MKVRRWIAERVQVESAVGKYLENSRRSHTNTEAGIEVLNLLQQTPPTLITGGRHFDFN